MSEYRNFGQSDEPRQRIPEGFWPDYMLNMAIQWQGVNNRLPPEKLPNGFVAAAQNCRMRNGDIEPRKGIVKPMWLNSAQGNQVWPAGTAVYGASVFSDPATREWTLIAADGYIWACAPGNLRFALTLPTGVSVQQSVRMVQAFDKVFMFRGRYLRPLVMMTIDAGFVDVLPQFNSATGGSLNNGVYQAAVQPINQLADQMAYGPFLAVNSMTQVNSLVTTVTGLPHGYVTGTDVVVQGATGAYTNLNGRWAVTVVDLYTFTFQVSVTGTATATGTILVSSMTNFWGALGDQLTVATGNLASTAGVGTITYTAHGLNTGQWITISGATPAGYNGIFQIQSVTTNTLSFYIQTGMVSPAVGTIYLYRPSVTAGHTPDTNPEAWTPVYNILPNADDALFVNGRLLVPTAYTPGDNGYDVTSSWTKKDFIVAMDIFDGVHFQFTNGFRINQGDDSEITNLVKYNANTVIVTKGKCWGVLSNLQSGDYSQITFDINPGLYGCTAQRAAVTAGRDVCLVSPGRGLTSLNQNATGLMQGVDIPVSNDVPLWLAQINWNAAALQRLAFWNDCLYWAVAINSSTVNNAVLVYDLRLHQWVSQDIGYSVMEFFHVLINGLDRLCFLDNSGWVNLLEEAVAGDMTGDLTQPGGTGWVEIPTDVTLKGHLFGQPGQKSYPLVELGLAVWNAKLTVTVSSGGVRTVRATSLTNTVFSRTAYLKPFDAVPWNALNVNQDYANPNRGDYSVVLLEGLILEGCSTLQWQEIFLRPSTKTFRASYALIRIQNATGRVKIKAATPAAQPGERRIGVMI